MIGGGDEFASLVMQAFLVVGFRARNGKHSVESLVQRSQGAGIPVIAIRSWFELRSVSSLYLTREAEPTANKDPLNFINLMFHEDIPEVNWSDGFARPSHSLFELSPFLAPIPRCAHSLLPAICQSLRRCCCECFFLSLGIARA